MNSAAKINLFPCNTREIWLGIFFLLTLGLVYAFQAYYVKPLGLRGLSLLGVTCYAFIGINFDAALLSQNRLVPHLVLLVFWSLVCMVDYLSADARIYKNVGFFLLVNVGSVFILQTFFLVAEKKRLNRSRAAAPVVNPNHFIWNARELFKGLSFFLILSVLYQLPSLVLQPLGLNSTLAALLLILLFLLVLFYLTRWCRNRIIPYLVLACFWLETSIIDRVQSPVGLSDALQSAAITFLITAAFILPMQLRFIFTEQQR